MAGQFKKLYKIRTIFSPILLDKNSSHNSCYKFSREEHLIAPVIAGATLYWTGSSVLENDELEGWS